MASHDEERLLTQEELTKLWAYEDMIRYGLQQYLKVGEALYNIKAEKLYREDFATFAEYCAEKWNLTDRHVRNLANAWEIALDLDPDPIGNADQLPANERQARELKQVPKDRRSEVWEAAVAEAGGVEHVCAHDVKTARERLLGDLNETTRWTEEASVHGNGAASQHFENDAPVTPTEEIVVITTDPANHAARIINKYGGQYAGQLIHELDRILTEKGL